jgi:hypothetical protein
MILADSNKIEQFVRNKLTNKSNKTKKTTFNKRKTYKK